MHRRKGIGRPPRGYRQIPLVLVFAGLLMMSPNVILCPLVPAWQDRSAKADDRNAAAGSGRRGHRRRGAVGRGGPGARHRHGGAQRHGQVPGRAAARRRLAAGTFHPRGDLAAACALLRQCVEGARRPPAFPYPAVVEREPGGAAADHVLHVQRSRLPLRGRLFPGLGHLRDERARAGRAHPRDEAHLPPHAARRARASARLDGKRAADQLLPHQPDAGATALRPAQRHLADPLHVPGAVRENRHRRRARQDRSRRIGQTVRRRAGQGGAERGQDRLHVRRRQAADALLLQHRCLQRRHQEQRLSQVLRGAGQRRRIR